MSTPRSPVAGGEPRSEQLTLRLSGAGPGRCGVRVTFNNRVGAGASHEQFTYTREQLRLVILSAEAAVRGAAPHGSAGVRDLGRPGAEAGAVLPPKEIGDWLFKMLFAGEVAHAFYGLFSFVAADPESSLSIRLLFEPDLPDLAEISALPWELMREPKTGSFLAQNPATPVVRYLEVAGFRPPAPLGSALRILAVTAQPAAASCLDLERERARLVAAWQGEEGAEVETLDHATLDSLGEKLMQGRFHVLHFMGHGAFDAAAGEGRLLLEDEQGGEAAVNGTVFCATVRGCPSLRLVVLNACSTAAMPRAPEHDPFAGVAAALLLGQIPAVVAMRRPISDRAALAFSGRFYTELAAGAPVDAAAARGRYAVMTKCDGSWEWATPVLYMSTPDGHILRPAAASTAASALPPAAPPAPSAALTASQALSRSRRPLRRRAKLLLLAGTLALASALLWGRHLLERGRLAPVGGEVLEAEDAARHLGQTATVCGEVVEVKSHEELPSKPTFIELGKAFPEQDLTGVIWGTDRKLFAEDLQAELLRRRVCLQGLISPYNGKPEIILKKPSQLMVPAPEPGQKEIVMSTQSRLRAALAGCALTFALLLAAPSPAPALTAPPAGYAAPSAAPAAAPAVRIAAADAARHANEDARVCGTVAGSKYAVRTHGKPTFLDFEKPYPASVFRVVIWDEDRGKFKEAPEAAYGQGKVCVNGRIKLYKGAPEIVVHDPSQLSRE